MALSQAAKDHLAVAMAGADDSDAREICAAIDALRFASPAAHVASMSNASSITIALSTTDTYTDAAVNTAVNTALASVVTDINADRAKINAILTSIINAGFML